MDVLLKKKPKFKKKPNKFSRLFSVVLMIVGLFLMGQAALPVISWYFLTMPDISNRIVSPLASTFSPIVSAVEIDSYSPSNWFTVPRETFKAPLGSKVAAFNLSIPKLDIEGASVVIDGDLKRSLVVWPTSPAPGSYGNIIIFGHSELPQFASPKDYSGIFTYLMTLDKGDDVYVDLEGTRFRYTVIDKKVTEPTDLAVLEQRFDAAYLTIITCVPPGTTWKRGIIKARLTVQ